MTKATSSGGKFVVTRIMIAVSLFTVPGTSLSAQAAPGVKITEVPRSSPGGPDEMFPISGEVSGVTQAKDFRVVIYVYAGGTWFVQPFDYSPKTEIRKDGKFETETHGGTIYAALLVKAGYTTKAQLKALPEVGGDVLARDRVAGK